MIKNLPAMQEMLVLSLSQEDPLEEAMATHSSILTWKIPWAEEPCRLQSMGLQRTEYDWACMHTHLGHFHILAILNNAAMNIKMHMSFQISVYICLGIHTEVEFLNHVVVLFLVFWGTYILIFIVAARVYIPINSVQGFPLLHIYPEFVFCRLFGDGYSNRCEVISYSSLIFIFLIISDAAHIFMFLSAIYMSYSVCLLPIFKSDCFLILSCVSCLYILNINS